MSGSLNEYYVPHVQPNQSQFQQTPPPPPPLPLSKEVNVNTSPIQVLLDTGAAVTVISTEFYHKVLRTSSALETSLNTSQVLQSPKMANGAHIPIEGIATFDLGLDQTKYRCSAYVVSGLSYSVVLGRDFLQQNRAIINMGTHTVEFFGDNVPMKVVH